MNKSKFILFAALFALTFTFFGCSGDDGGVLTATTTWAPTLTTATCATTTRVPTGTTTIRPTAFQFVAFRTKKLSEPEFSELSKCTELNFY